VSPRPSEAQPAKTIEPGAIVKVRINWPGTRRKTFEVRSVRPYEGSSCTGNTNDPTVDCWELEGGRKGKLRSFPLSAVELTKGTQKRFVRGNEPPLIGKATREGRTA